MSKLMITAIAVGFVIATSTFGFAAPGKSGSSPGHQMQQNGPVAGHPGASGYAPGHLKNKKAKINRRHNVVRNGDRYGYGYAPSR
jgi:hypothetical protein